MPPPPDLKELFFDAFVNRLRTITVANGYHNTVLLVDRQHIELRDEVVPCLFVNDGKEAIQHLPDREAISTYTFSVGGGIIATPDVNAVTSSVCATMLNNFIQDFLRCIYADIRLGGMLHKELRVPQIGTDEGIMNPKAMFMADVVAQIRYKVVNR